MSITVTCGRCEQELTEPGGLLFSPPDSGGECWKQHLCRKCYRRVARVVQVRPIAEVERLSADDPATVEIVARAIHAEHCMQEYGAQITWESAGDDEQRVYRALARAALAALRNGGER